MILRSITGAMKTSPTVTLHKTLRAEAGKTCSRVGFTTMKRYAEKRIIALCKLAAIENSGMLFENMATHSIFDKKYRHSQPKNMGSNNIPKYGHKTAGSPIDQWAQTERTPA